ncbi:MAG: type II toxin-antitoxin system VapC family toxin [Treponema sp.]|nr:type II toxin-antitoxin system VapC family toxin [Treponema sp.]
MDKLKKNRKRGLYLSSITLAELEFGIENADPAYNIKNRMALMNFLTLFEVKCFDEYAAKEYGKIKKELKDKKYLIGPFDMLIGAHAKSLNMILVTNNTEEFKRINGLKIEDWK